MLGNIAFKHLVTSVEYAARAARTLAGAVRRSSLAAALKNVCNLLTNHPASSTPRSGPDDCSAAAASPGPAPADGTNPSLGAQALSAVIDHHVLRRSGHLSPLDQVRLASVNKLSREQLSHSLAIEKERWESHELAEKAKTICSIERFLEFHKTVGSLRPECQNEPLNVLGRRIHNLPWVDQYLAIVRFKEAVERLPDEHRHGLLGMYMVAESGDIHAFSQWKVQSTNAVIQEVLKTDARYSQSARRALEERFGLTGDAKYMTTGEYESKCDKESGGLTENASRRRVETAVRERSARDLLKTGVSPAETLRKLDLGNYKVEYKWNEVWRRYEEDVESFGACNWWKWELEEFYVDAFSLGLAKLEMITGKIDYLTVADQHGIRGEKARQEMADYYKKAHSEPLAQPALDDLLAGQTYDAVARNHGITSDGLISRMEEAAEIISWRA